MQRTDDFDEEDEEVRGDGHFSDSRIGVFVCSGQGGRGLLGVRFAGFILRCIRYLFGHSSTSYIGDATMQHQVYTSPLLGTAGGLRAYQ